jgi:hypothetical protein
MDLFDLFPVATGPEPAKGGSAREKLVGGAVVFGLPMLHLCLLTLTELSKQPSLAVLWLPATFAGIGALACVLARLSLGRAIVAVLGCLWWCLFVGLALVAIDILIFPF